MSSNHGKLGFLALIATVLLVELRVAAAPPKPRFTVHREGAALVVRNIRDVQASGGAGCELLAFRVEPITAAIKLWRWEQNAPSRAVTTEGDISVAQFFPSELTVGAAVMVPASAVAEIVAIVDRPGATLLDLLPLFDGRRVYSYDMTRVRPAAGGAKIHSRWEGSDLVVDIPAPNPDLVVFGFVRTAGAASELTAEVRPLLLTGDVGASAAPVLRYPSATRGADDAVSFITSRVNGTAIRQLLQKTPQPRFAGLDVLFRTGVVQSVDFARPQVVVATGDVRKRLSDIQKSTVTPVTQAKNADELTTATIKAYDAYTAAIPQDLLRIPRVWEHANEIFLNDLAWTSFFRHISFANSMGRIEYIRNELNQLDPTHNIGEEFVFSYADRFLAKYPLKPALLDARITIAERFFGMKPQALNFKGKPLPIDTVIADYYQLVGRFIASDAATAIEKWQSDGTTKLGDDDYLRLAQRLAAMNVYLSERKGMGTKVLEYFRRADIRKLFQRATDEFLANSERGKILQTATYNVESQRAFAQNQLVFYDVSYTSNGVKRPLGHLLLVQPTAQLKYGYTVRKEQAGYTSADLQKRFGTARFYVVTAGSYTESTLRTSGLSAENGVIKNFHVTHKMDGFVAIRRSALEVFDLENGLKLPGRTDVIRPIRSLRDFHTFVTWLRSEGVSGFQTHLLVRNNGAAIEPEKTSNSRRERRFLLSMRDEHGRRVIGVLDIPVGEAINFAESTAVIRRLLHDGYKYNVENAVNLDTGSFDILQVRRDDGSVIYATPNDIAGATNLMVIYP